MPKVKTEKKFYRLWSMATKTCLVLTVKNNKVESVTCKESAREDDSGESSRLQLFMLMEIRFFRLFSSTCTSS